MEELGGYQAGFDVVRAFAIGHLCKYYAQKLVEISEVFDFAFPLVPSGTSVEIR